MVISSLPFIKKKQVKQEDLLKKQKEFKLNNDNTNKVKLISAQDEALLSRIALIKQAKKRINMSYYHINTDHKSAQIFIAALIQAANSGVEVNIIVDAKFSGISPDFVCLLSNQKNIKLYFYNPINLRKPESLQVSLHTKFMLLDNRWIISGGHNIDDAFLYEASTNRVISYDLDVLIKFKN